MKKLIFILTSAISSVFAADSQVDLRLDTNPSDLNGKSAFNVVTTTAIQADSNNHALLFTPEMSFYANGGIDFSVTSAHRHRHRDFVWGHNVFFDRTNVGGQFCDQVGTGLDLLTNRFDFRINYYHPITDYGASPLRACKWADSEIFFKTKYFGVGTGPLYNVDMKHWALHSRLVVPCRDFTLNFGGLCGEAGYSSAIFSISFHLFKPKNPDTLTCPPCHVQKANIYYNTGYYLQGASHDDILHGKVKIEYNPNVMTYIDQSEEEITFQDKKSIDEK